MGSASVGRGGRSGAWVVGLMALVGAAECWAQPGPREINPGLLGANALPPFEVGGPWIDDRWVLSFGVAGQLSWPRKDTDVSYTLPFRLEYPFVRRAALWVEGTPLEGYSYSLATQRAWAPSRPAGVTPGDVTFGSRFVLFPGKGWLPALGVRVVVKTATGEDLRTRRFLDAPAYQFDALVGERFQLEGGRLGLLELSASVGFLAWQQGTSGQNDAVAGSGRLRWAHEHLALRLEVRGYAGWQGADRPLVGVLGAEWKVAAPLSLELVGTRSFVDPPGFELRLGVRLSGPELKLR